MCVIQGKVWNVLVSLQFQMFQWRQFQFDATPTCFYSCCLSCFCPLSPDLGCVSVTVNVLGCRLKKNKKQVQVHSFSSIDTLDFGHQEASWVPSGLLALAWSWSDGPVHLWEVHTSGSESKSVSSDNFQLTHRSIPPICSGVDGSGEVRIRESRFDQGKSKFGGIHPQICRHCVHCLNLGGYCCGCYCRGTARRRDYWDYKLWKDGMMNICGQPRHSLWHSSSTKISVTRRGDCSAHSEKLTAKIKQIHTADCLLWYRGTVRSFQPSV